MSKRRPITFFGLVVSVVALHWSCTPDPGADGVSLRVELDSLGRHVDVLGFEPSLIDSLHRGELGGIFTVQVASELNNKGNGTVTPIIGDYPFTADGLRFEPRFPLVEGVKYELRINLDAIQSGLKTLAGEKVFTALVRMPEREIVPSTQVAAVYPSGDVLPANLLKLYIQFSRSMSRGDVYTYIHLFDEKGRELEKPFLDLQQELWDPESRRFTLLFDPGRIKRGLRSHAELGDVFEVGKNYTLEIDAAWKDARGAPLVQPYRKTFRIGEVDRLQPNISDWRFDIPNAGTRDALVVDLAEPLDHALLGRVVDIRDSRDKFVFGRIRIEAGERVWRFTPDEPWRGGSYRIRAEGILEDRAGNSLARPFEFELGEGKRNTAEIQTERYFFRFFEIPIAAN